MLFSLVRQTTFKILDVLCKLYPHVLIYFRLPIVHYYVKKTPVSRVTRG